MTVTPAARRSGGWQLAVAAGVVALAGVAGWVLAGPPVDGGGTVPPGCPAALPLAPLTAGRRGDADRLVPVPLPQPRGPVAVRICAYASDQAGSWLRRSAVLDPPRTAELAGVMNVPDPNVAPIAVGARPPDCPAGGPVILLLFRYTQGEPLVAEVDAGACALVSTSARVERDRTDVVQRVARTIS